MLNRDEIIQFIKSQKNELRNKYHIIRIGLFGSFARNDKQKSDIDIIIEFEDNTENIYELKEELRGIFQEKFNMPVDIAREKYLKPYIKESIINETVYVD